MEIIRGKKGGKIIMMMSVLFVLLCSVLSFFLSPAFFYYSNWVKTRI